LDRSCEKLQIITKVQGGKNILRTIKGGMLIGLVISSVGRRGRRRRRKQLLDEIKESDKDTGN
jgi:hypothetical protein